MLWVVKNWFLNIVLPTKGRSFRMFKEKDGTMQRMVLDICFILIIIRGYNMIDIIIINTKTNRISEKKIWIQKFRTWFIFSENKHTKHDLRLPPDSRSSGCSPLVLYPDLPNIPRLKVVKVPQELWEISCLTNFH